MKIGSLENPCTSKNSTVEEIGHKWCECDYCHCICKCTVEFDFYFQADGTLKCQQCVVDDARRRGMKTTGFGPDRGRS